jgi:hypothetical protein
MRVPTMLLPLAAAFALLAPAAAAAPCPAPDDGWRSCLRAGFTVTDDGSARVTELVVKLVERRDCDADLPRRRMRLMLDGVAPVERSRRREARSCRNGVARWKATLREPASRPWGLRAGDELHADWSKLDDAGGRATVVIPDASIED